MSDQAPGQYDADWKLDLYTDPTESAPMGYVAGRQQHRETGRDGHTAFSVAHDLVAVIQDHVA